MDVFGRKPTSKEGEYFRNNVWWWHPLADYCIEIAPEIAERCEGWHFNDGDGLNGQDSAALADALQEEIRSGRCGAYAEIRKAELVGLPNERCTFCEGTGVRSPTPKRAAGDAATGVIMAVDKDDEAIQFVCSDAGTTAREYQVDAGEELGGGFKCRTCDGSGSIRPWACAYPFEVENVQAFVTFLRGSGGFVIG
jgi:hypothetical protein